MQQSLCDDRDGNNHFGYAVRDFCGLSATVITPGGIAILMKTVEYCCPQCGWSGEVKLANKPRKPRDIEKERARNRARNKRRRQNEAYREKERKRHAAWKKKTKGSATDVARRLRASEQKKRYRRDPATRPQYLARWAGWHAVRAGKLAKQPCAKCGNVIVQMHHTDYSKPLEITWLCRVHHLEAHGKRAISETTTKTC
jgi:uncharacterized Zn finger protein (UPF0148 family)